MAGVIDLRENPAQQMQIARTLGGDVAHVINSYRRRRAEQMIVHTLSRANAEGWTPEQTRAKLFEIKGLVDTQVGQEFMQTLPEFQDPLQRKALEARIGATEASTEASRARKTYYERGGAGGNLADEIGKWQRILNNAEINSNDELAEMARQQLANLQGQAGYSAPSDNLVQPENVPLGKTLGLEGLWHNLNATQRMQALKQLQQGKTPEQVIASYQARGEKKQYSLEDPGRPGNKPAFERNLAKLTDETRARAYYDKWAKEVGETRSFEQVRTPPRTAPIAPHPKLAGLWPRLSDETKLKVRRAMDNGYTIDEVMAALQEAE